MQARLLTDKGNRVEAELVEVVTPSPHRRAAPCPYYAACGGCQLQHMTYAAQCDVRRGFVTESLAKVGVPHVPDPDFVPSPFELGYRTRLQLAVDRGRVGFLRRRSSEIVEVESCPICLSELGATIPPIRDYVTRNPAFAPVGQAFAVAGENGKVAAEPTPDPAWPREVRWTVGGIRFTCLPDVFFQANAHLLDAFQSVACDDMSGGTAIDLFGGTGFFALPLARAFKAVTVIEENRSAVALGKKNAKDAGFDNVRFIASRVEDLEAETFGPRPDLAVVDPPRAGLSNKAFGVLAALAPARMMYVSCDPVSLARDLKKLADAGWNVSRLTVIDIFPQTFHVETVAYLTR